VIRIFDVIVGEDVCIGFVSTLHQTTIYEETSTGSLLQGDNC